MELDAAEDRLGMTDAQWAQWQTYTRMATANRTKTAWMFPCCAKI